MASSKFPWLYAYQEDGPRLGEVTLRPTVPIALVGSDVSAVVYALVDSGCSHILAAPWLADSAGIDTKNSGRALKLGIGSDNVDVEFADARVRLMSPAGLDSEFVEYEAEVGFVTHWRPTWPILVGQRGFLDKFTVTTSLFAKQTAVEAAETFDERYGIPLAPV